MTLNMPTRQGNQVHQVIAEHPANSLTEFVQAMGEAEFIIVSELYRDNDAPERTSQYYSVGEIAINPAFVGKVKVFHT